MNKLSKEEFDELLAAVIEAYELVGKKIQTATLYDGDNTELVIDNREDKEIN